MKFFILVAGILSVGALVFLSGPATAQQAYPTKPIRFIVPFPPGGSTDPLARMIGQKMTENWGKQVIVDNRPGARGCTGFCVNGFSVFKSAAFDLRIES